METVLAATFYCQKNVHVSFRLVGLVRLETGVRPGGPSSRHQEAGLPWALGWACSHALLPVSAAHEQAPHVLVHIGLQAKTILLNIINHMGSSLEKSQDLVFTVYRLEDVCE